MTSLFDKLAKQEKEFFASKFMSPVLKGQPIRVRIAGVAVELEVRPKSFSGWGLFESKDQKTCQFVDKPSRAQKQQYLKLYPNFTMVVCRQKRAFGILASQDNRVVVQGLIPIQLPEEIRIFDTINVRFDGKNFWYDSHSASRSPRIAVQIRDLLAEETDPSKLVLSGMTPQERLSYSIAFDHEIESKRDKKEERLKKSLERGGAVLRSYVERGDTYTVEFTVDGERHRSVVNSETLKISSAGICLSGGDAAFDLQSLVGVIREGHERSLIYRM